MNLLCGRENCFFILNLIKKRLEFLILRIVYIDFINMTNIIMG